MTRTMTASPVTPLTPGSMQSLCSSQASKEYVRCSTSIAIPTVMDEEEEYMYDDDSLYQSSGPESTENDLLTVTMDTSQYADTDSDDYEKWEKETGTQVPIRPVSLPMTDSDNESGDYVNCPDLQSYTQSDGKAISRKNSIGPPRGAARIFGPHEMFAPPLATPKSPPPPYIQEDAPSNDTQSGCTCCAEVPDTSHWILVEPEVSTEKTISIYSLSSAAGSYECSDSSLRWSCVGPVTLQYCFMDWQVFAEELAQMQCSPAGPLMDIKLISGEVEEIHLPHFLCLGGSQSALNDAVKVLHQQNGGVCLEMCELSRSHARLLNPSFSPLGVLFNSLKSFLLTKIHTDVHVYRSSLKPLIFHVYLMPRNVQLKKLVEEQEKSEKFRGVLLERPRPVRPLQLRSYYSLQTNCTSTVLPGELELSDDNTVTPNYSIVRVDQAGTFKITLLNSAQRAVWQAEISKAECWPPRQGTADASSRGPVSTLPCGIHTADTHTAVNHSMGWQEVHTPECATRVPQSGMVSHPVPVDILDWLFSGLDDLDSDQLKRFKLYLSQRGTVQGFEPIPFGQLEQCDATGVASKVKQAYGEDGAVTVTLSILKRMKLHLLAMRLERDSPASSPVSLRESPTWF